MQFNYFKPKFNFVVKPRSKRVHFDIISCVWEKMLSEFTYKAFTKTLFNKFLCVPYLLKKGQGNFWEFFQVRSQLKS